MKLNSIDFFIFYTLGEQHMSYSDIKIQTTHLGILFPPLMILS